jgi:hypothetical protein
MAVGKLKTNYNAQTTHMTKKSRTHVFKFLTSPIPSMQKIVNLQGYNKFINQEIQTYYLVSVDRYSTAVHLTRSNCAGSSTVDGTARSEREEDEGTNCDDGGSDTEWYR